MRWWSGPRAILRTVLMLDDTPHSIALGTAIGMFIGMTPTVGIQMLLVMAFAFVTSRFLHFNRMAALITVYISNPITVLPIYWLDYQIGSMIVGGTLSYETLAGILEYNSIREWWATIVALFVEIGVPLVIGSLIVASIASAITYPIIWYLLSTMRRGYSKKRHSHGERVAAPSGE